ncbi:AAEL006195-PA [Aedes aegypti]|uniref:Odorant receptor n=2 Tax=Aedes aegypti TaxID=7159 RepID=A0A1S7UEF7_AEDAE|nr:odorant receptor 74 [Aedes aegypti]EAT42235.1 AAEL006195-PA [Aedes aegypti]DAA80410.1 TPA_exp: odorant receptor 74 [Aedes aegypti]
MFKFFRSIKPFLIEKYRKFNASDNSFVVMMFCNHFVGIFDNPDPDPVRIRLLKRFLLTFAIVYVFSEVVSVFLFEAFSVEQDFGILFMTFGRLLCIVMWSSFAMHHQDLKRTWLFLLNTQQDTPDDRRRKFIRTVNWITLMFLMQDVLPMVVWAMSGHSESSLQLYNNHLIDQVNALANPIVVVVLTMMFCYSVVVVGSVLPALTLEFHILGLDFELLFEDVGSLSDGDNWDAVEAAFKRCVDRHQVLLDTAKALRKQLKIYFLVQLGINFVAIVFSTLIYIYTQRSNDSSYVFNAFGAMSIMCNLLLYGYLCDRLEEQVAAINRHLYCSNWTGIKFDSTKFGKRYKNLRRMMLIVMERTQKKVGFTCGNFFGMSLVTCRKVLWFAYTVLAMLMHFLE